MTWMVRGVHFKGLDLNLLVALEALLETRSVSRAANRLNLSQPAMSASLARLRDYFQDELLIAKGKHMYATSVAESLLPRLKECLQQVDALIATPTRFEPGSAARTFSIVTSDYFSIAVLAPLIASLARAAPGIKIDILSPTPESHVHLAQGKVDLIIAPDGYQHADHPAELLLEERLVVVAWQDHPILSGQLTEADLFSYGHVAVAIGRDRVPSFADRQLAKLGKSRRIEVMTESFVAVPWLLKDTERLALMHERLARAVMQYFPIRSVPLPFDFPVMREMVQYNRDRSCDDGLRWLRSRLAETCAAT